MKAILYLIGAGGIGALLLMFRSFLAGGRQRAAGAADQKAKDIGAAADAATKRLEGAKDGAAVQKEIDSLLDGPKP